MLLVLSQRNPRIWVTVGTAVALGLVLEILQSFTGDRSASVIDLVANATGAAIGGAFCWWRRSLAAKPVGEI